MYNIQSPGQNRPDLAERLEAYMSKGPVYKRLMKAVHHVGDMATFCHGDCWNNNYMFRYETNSEGKEVPVEVKMYDLQVSRYVVESAEKNESKYTFDKNKLCTILNTTSRLNCVVLFLVEDKTGKKRYCRQIQFESRQSDCDW